MDGIEDEGSHYLLEVHDSLAGLDAREWNQLLAESPRPTPFWRHEYLCALHDSDSASPQTGWTPRVLTLRRQGRLVGATLAYLKSHSWGEYVFDWAWAEAHERQGLNYYPKLLTASPFTPVAGSRLLARSAQARRALLRGLRQMAEEAGLLSAHVLFIDEADAAAARAEGWLLRQGVQFHWARDDAQPCADFAAYLATLQRDKRKKIQQERRKVRDAGVRFSVHEGRDIGAAQWDFFHHCYTLTYRAHGGTPYLTRDFFRRVAQALPEHWLLFTAERDGQPVATSLLAIDRASGQAWGRYWGCIADIDCLHFEACYYQPLSWCISQGFRRFEGGAQGEHKMARGLLPAATHSAHWLADPRLARAVEHFLAQESAGLDDYVDELRERNPFLRPPDRR